MSWCPAWVSKRLVCTPSKHLKMFKKNNCGYIKVASKSSTLSSINNYKQCNRVRQVHIKANSWGARKTREFPRTKRLHVLRAGYETLCGETRQDEIPLYLSRDETSRLARRDHETTRRDGGIANIFSSLYKTFF